MQRTDREIVNSMREAEAELDDAEEAVTVATKRLERLEREWMQSHKCSCGLMGFAPCDH
jgi:hypothetical protein